MPLDRYITLLDFSKQVKQYNGTTAILSGITNHLEGLFIKSIEVDTFGATVGDVLVHNGAKFVPGTADGFGNRIVNGMNTSLYTGLTYYISPGSYRLGNTYYAYTGGYATVSSGDSINSRFDLFYITSAQTVFISEGTPATNPLVPIITSDTQLQVSILLIPAGFTGGTGSTIISVTANTVFEYNTGATIGGIQRQSAYNALATGNFSFAASRNSRAYSDDSVALGLGIFASGSSQVAVGQYNTVDINNYFVVGDGVDGSNRSTAFSVTKSGYTRAEKKLFVTDVEIETTGATTGKVLKFNGTKFTPQFETITGITFAGSGIQPISSITNNSLIINELSGRTGIIVSQSGNNIFFDSTVTIASLSGLTDLQSVGNGISLISGKTGTTQFLYSVTGLGAISITKVNDVLIFSSATSGISSNLGMQNVGGSVGIWKDTTSTDYRLYTLTGVSGTSVYRIGDVIYFSSQTPTVTSQTELFENIGYSEILTKVSNSSLERGKLYRIISGRTNQGINTFGYIISEAIESNMLSKNAVLIGLNPDYYDSGNYSDISNGGRLGQAYNGLSVVTNEIFIYNGYHYRNTGSTLTFSNINNEITGVSFQQLPKNFTQNYGYKIFNDIIEYNLTSDTVYKRIDSYGNTIESETAINKFQFGRFNQVFNNKVVNNSVIENLNHLGTFKNNTIQNNSKIVSSFTDSNTVFDSNVFTNGVNISSITLYSIVLSNNFISNDFGFTNVTLSSKTFDNKVVNSDFNSFETNFTATSSNLNLSGYNFYGIFNILPSPNGLTITSITNYNNSNQITFRPLSGYNINFAHTTFIKNELADTHPILGSYDEEITYQKRSKTGSTFYQKNINTYYDYNSGSTGTTSGITSAITVGSAFSSISGINNSVLYLKSFSAGGSLTIIDLGDKLLFSGGSSTGGGGTGFTDAQNVGNGARLLSSYTPTTLYFRTLSATTGLGIYESGDYILFSANTSTFFSGVTGATNIGSGIGLFSSNTENNLLFKTLTGGSGISVYTQGNLVFISATTQTASTLPYTGFTGFTSISGGVNLLSANTPYSFVQKALVGLGGVSITENNGIVSISSTTSSTISSTSLYIEITYADALDNVVNKTNSFVKGSNYRIINRTDTGFNTFGDIILNAVDDYKLSINGEHLAFIADYYNQGDYTDSGGANIGQAYTGLSVGLSDIVSYNNNHYFCNAPLTFSSITTQLISNFSLLAKDYTMNNGYIVRPRKIIYNIFTDTIKKTIDEYNNEIHKNEIINLFQFQHKNDGDVSCANNIIKLINEDAFNSLNLINRNYLSTFNNNIIYLLNTLISEYDGSTDIRFMRNYINSSLFYFNNFTLVNTQDIHVDDKNSNFINTSYVLDTSGNLVLDGYELFGKITPNLNSTPQIVTAITTSVGFSFDLIIQPVNANIIRFKNSATIKTEGGLDAVINGTSNDNITFRFINGIFYQINSNNYS